MRRLLAPLALVVATGCGGGAADKVVTDPGPTAAATPTMSASDTGSSTPSVQASSATAPPVTGRPTATPSPSSHSAGPTPTTAPGEPLLLGNADSGRTVTVAAGTQIRVRLQPELGNYDPPTASGPVLRRISSSGGYPGSDPVDAVFTAATTGSADLSATTDAQCLHAQPRCMIPQKQWLVHVVVR